nr:DUF3265 domain-containing protein [Photobacterium damselae]
MTKRLRVTHNARHFHYASYSVFKAQCSGFGTHLNVALCVFINLRSS